MSKYPKLSPQKYEEWIKSGRGSGTGADYLPFVTVHDFPSQGRVHRVWGIKTNRVHHLLSDLERNVFVCAEAPKKVEDLREQYPLLPVEETLEIAKEMGIRHPLIPGTKFPFILTTDLYLSLRTGLDTSYQPLTIKYVSGLNDPRAKDYVELERRYWLRRRQYLKIITEQHVSISFVENRLWVRPYHDISALYPLTKSDVNRLAAALTRCVLKSERPLSEVARSCDQALGLPRNTSLAIARHLLANRFWRVRMNELIEPTNRLILLNSPKAPMYANI